VKKCICWCLSIIELKNAWWNTEIHICHNLLSSKIYITYYVVVTVLIYPIISDFKMQHCSVCYVTPRNWIQYGAFVMYNTLSFTLRASKCIFLSINSLINVQKAVKYCIYDSYHKVKTNILRKIQHISQDCILQTLMQRGCVVVNCFTSSFTCEFKYVFVTFSNGSPTTKCEASNNALCMSRR